MGQPNKGQVLIHSFPKVEHGIFIKCDVHAWMSAYVHVLDHPFHTITGEDGTFEIIGLPPGDYELKAWHEFRRFTPDRNPIKVTVKGGKASELVITYSASKD